MIYKSINLKDYYKALKYDVKLTILCPDNYQEIDINRIRPGILITPGGGYAYTSSREAEPVALRFLGYDFATFILYYSCDPNTDFPFPFIEGFAAIDYIRKHADEFHLDINNLNVMGFSSGGHFSASLCAYKDHEIVKKYLGNDIETEINGCILGYPVISSNPEFAHIMSFVRIGKVDHEKLDDFFSIEKHITNKFPRTFIFACINDPGVSIKNSYALVDALKKENVEVEEHYYDVAIHGTSLGDRSVYNDQVDLSSINKTKDWPLLAIDFIRRKK